MKKIFSIKFLLSVVTVTLLLSFCVFAADEPTVTTATDALKTGLADMKGQFLAVVGVVVAAGLAIFGVKFGIKQGIGVFKSVSK